MKLEKERNFFKKKKRAWGGGDEDNRLENKQKEKTD